MGPRSNRFALFTGVVVVLWGSDLLWELIDPFVRIRTLTSAALLGTAIAAGSGLLVLAAVRCERERVSTLCVRRMARDDWIAAAAAAGAVLAFDVFVGPLLVSASPLSWNEDNLATMQAAPTVLLMIRAILVAPVAEELIYRGYTITRLGALTGRPRLAAAVPVVLFALAHLPFYGTAKVFDTAFFAIVMSVLFLRRGNLTACIVVHAATNALGYVPELYAALAWIAVVGGPLLLAADAVARPAARYPSGGKVGWVAAFGLSLYGFAIGLPVAVAGVYWLKVRRHGGTARPSRAPSGPFEVTFVHATA